MNYMLDSYICFGIFVVSCIILFIHYYVRYIQDQKNKKPEQIIMYNPTNIFTSNNSEVGWTENVGEIINDLFTDQDYTDEENHWKDGYQ